MEHDRLRTEGGTAPGRGGGGAQTLEKCTAGAQVSRRNMAESITLELLYPDARAPERATEDSAGYDLFVYLTHRTVSCSGPDGTWELPTFRDREKKISYFELPPAATAMM